MWTLGHDQRIPAAVREAMAEWGLCKDEFVESGNWPPSLYVREARRMVGTRVLTQNDVREARGADIGAESLGLAAHAEDSHNMQRFACGAAGSKKDDAPCFGAGPRGTTPGTPYAWNEGDFHGVDGGHVYQLPRFVALPKPAQAANLLVVCAPSASHVAFSTFRMEPAFMVMGHSIGTWAALAAATPGGDVGAVPASALHSALVADGQVLKTPTTPPPPPQPWPPHPPHPHPHPHPEGIVGYDCRAKVWDRCVGVVALPAGSNASCAGGCEPLRPQEWLASTAAFKLVRGKNGSAVLPLPGNAARWLKKSEGHSSTLPASEKLLVPPGGTVAIASATPALDDRYWLVSCRGGAHCGLP